MPDSARKDQAQLHALVTGRVQGVGFRWYVLQHARRLGLSGWVRNLVDGNVEILAEGPKRHLESLVESLRKGPSYSQVFSVDVSWDIPTGRYGGFDVTY